MKNLSVSLFSALGMLVLGILFIAFPDKMTEWLVVLVGFLFLLPSVVYLLTGLRWMRRTEQENAAHPLSLILLSVGSLCFGLNLILAPTFFIRFMMFILGCILIAQGGVQLYRLYTLRRISSIHSALFCISVLIVLAGFFIVLNPIESASLPFIVLGCASLVYGLSECYRIFKLWQSYKTIQGEIEAPPSLDEYEEIKD